MPPSASQVKPQRWCTSTTKSSLGSEPAVRLQQHHSRHSSSSSSPSSLPLPPAAVKSRGGRAFPVHDGPNRPRPRDNNSTPSPRSDRLSQREIAEQRPSHNTTGTRTSDQKKPAPPPLKTRDILRNPRLQQVTGIFPGKADLWSGRELPPNELSRLAWAMTLPEPFPFKRPRGEFRGTPIGHGIKKT